MRLKRIRIFSDYLMFNLLGRGLIAATIAVAALVTLVLSIIGPSLLSGSFGGGLSALIALTGFFGLFAGILASKIADEISEGTAAIYLAQPLTRTEFIVSWIIAGPVSFTLVYLLSVVTPILVFAPSSILNPGVGISIATSTLQVVYYAMLGLVFALLTRHRGVSVFVLLLYIFIAPIVVLSLLALAITPFRGPTTLVAAEAYYIASIFDPVMSLFAPRTIPISPLYGLTVASIATIILIFSSWFLVKRLEV